MHITLVYLKAYQLNQHYFDLMNKFRLCDDFFFVMAIYFVCYFLSGGKTLFRLQEKTVNHKSKSVYIFKSVSLFFFSRDYHEA